MTTQKQTVTPQRYNNPPTTTVRENKAKTKWTTQATQQALEQLAQKAGAAGAAGAAANQGGGAGAAGAAGAAGPGGAGGAPNQQDNDDRNGFSKMDYLLKNVVKLSLKNFHNWKTSIENLAYIREWDQDLFDLTTVWNQQEEPNRRIRASRREAYGVLLYSIPQELRYLIENVAQGDAKGIYKTVHHRFVVPSSRNTGVLIKEAWNTTMETTGLPADKFISELIKRTKELESLGKPFTVQEVKTLIYSGLCREFNPIVTNLELNDNLTINQVVTNIFEYARKHNLMNVTKRRKPTETDGTVFTALHDEQKINECRFWKKYGKCKFGKKCKWKHTGRPVQPTPPPPGGRKVKCYHCGDPHLIKNCRKLKKLQELKERLDNETENKNKNGRAYYARQQGNATPEEEEEEDEDDEEAIQFTMMKLPKWAKETKTKKNDWIFDGAASQHITNNIKDFVKGSMYSVQVRMKVGNGETVKIKQAGKVKPKDKHGNPLSPRCQLNDVFYMPECPVKLISEPTLDMKGAIILKSNGKLKVYNKSKELLMQGCLLPTKLYRLFRTDKAKLTGNQDANTSHSALFNQTHSQEEKVQQRSTKNKELEKKTVLRQSNSTKNQPSNRQTVLHQSKPTKIPAMLSQTNRQTEISQSKGKQPKIKKIGRQTDLRI